MKLKDLKNKKTVMIKPYGLLNYYRMKVTETLTGFTISNYSNKRKEAIEYLFVVDEECDLKSLDILIN